MITPKNYVAVTDACKIAGVSRPTMVAWCRDRGIGKKIAGRWFVDSDRLTQLLQGEVQYFTEEKNAKNKKSNKQHKRRG